MAAPNKVFCCLIAALLGLGIYDVLTNFEDNRCAMSYMWELPTYVPVPNVNQSIQEKYPHYSLTVYGEGKYAKDLRKMHLSGIPVLYIPGNAGSHKQVRSLSSIALRKAAKYNFHFNYFSVDLNEELNGVYGGVLEGQTEYVEACIDRILSLYQKSKNPPKQVVLIAHSKGGLVAKALFAQPGFDASRINTLITMGTPHVTAVVKPDIYLDQFAARVGKFWSENWNSPELRHLTLLSIGGGYRDNMVRSGLVSMDGMVAPDRGLSVVVGAIPRVWLSTDHRCIVWCKELVLATNRALFDMVDKLTRQMSVNPEYRMLVLKHHFVSHDGENSYTPHTEDAVGFADENFKSITTGFHHVAGRHNQKAVHFTFPIDINDPKYDAFTVTATMTETRGWLVICTRSHEERCIEGVDVTRRVSLMPPLKADQRVAHFDFNNLDVAGTPKQMVVRIPTANKVHMIADLYKRSDRTKNATLPGFFSYKPKVVFKQHDSTSLFFNISLPGLESVWQAYTATLEPAHCQEPVRKDGNTTLHLHVPWYQEDEWTVTKATENNVMSVKLQSGRPSDDNRPVQLHVYVYSRCHYRLKIAVSHREMLGQMVRFYGYLLPCFVVDVALLVVSYMFANIDKKKPVESFITTQSTYCKPYMVAPFVAVARNLLPYISESWAEFHDFNILDRQNINFGLLPLVSFLFGYGVLCIMAAIMELDVQFFGKIFSLFRGTSLALESPQSGGSLGYSIALYALLGGLMSLCVGSCGAVVLLMATVIYLLKVIHLQAKVYILKGCLNLTKDENIKDSKQEKTVENKSPKDTDANSSGDAATPTDEDTPTQSRLDVANTSLYFHFTMMMLLLLMTLLNLPSFSVWVKNMRHEEYNLEQDPAQYPTIAVLIALSVLLDPAYTLPKKGLLTKVFSWTVHILTIAAVLYGMDSMYRLSYAIAATVFLAAINQAFSR